MLGKQSAQRGLFEADNQYADFVGRDTFYGFLASQRGKLFRDEDFADLYCPDNGRTSVPPSVLATALVLQTHDGVSDAEAKARADYDLRWKVALGTELAERPFAKSTLQLFRAQLILHEKARSVFRGSLEMAKANGFLRRRKKLHVALDTLAILGRGAVKDTYNLLADGIGKLVRTLAEHDETDAAGWAAEHEFERYLTGNVKGEAAVDWDDASSRQAFLAEIVSDAKRLLTLAGEACSRSGKDSDAAQEIEAAAALLTQLLCQDIEYKDDEPQIKQGVAKDRIPSVHDPEMRHGRKSSTGRFNGHKGAVAVDTESQLITAVDVIPGNAHDSEKTLDLVEQSEADTGMEVADTVGDCAYGAGETRREFDKADRKLVAPVPRPPQTGKFPKTAFKISRKEDRVTCPGGCTTKTFNWAKTGVKRSGNRYRVKRFVFPNERCATCPLRAKCGGGAGPRTITLHPQEAMMQRARRYQQTEGFRDANRRRQTVEHRIARLRQLGVRQARYVGRAKTLFQLLMAATVANLTLVARATGQIASSCAHILRRWFGATALRTVWDKFGVLIRLSARRWRPAELVPLSVSPSPVANDKPPFRPGF